MKEFMEHTDIIVEHVDHGATFDIMITLYKGSSYAKVRIAVYHTNIVLIEKDGSILRQVEVKGEAEDGLTDRSLLNMEDIWDFANTVDIADVKGILDREGKRGEKIPCSDPVQSHSNSSENANRPFISLLRSSKCRRWGRRWNCVSVRRRIPGGGAYRCKRISYRIRDCL